MEHPTAFSYCTTETMVLVQRRNVVEVFLLWLKSFLPLHLPQCLGTPIYPVYVIVFPDVPVHDVCAM